MKGSGKGAFWLGTVALALAGAAAVSAEPPVPNGSPDAAGLPRTAKPLARKDDRLRFVVIGDRTGGHRPGVFERAMDQINLLQPNFVISVGDHIEGYTEDSNAIRTMWDEVEAAVGKLQMPFFHVVGNHDMSNSVMRQAWNARLGRDYYHFVQDGVLFIALNTEDPPPPRVDKKDLFAKFDQAKLMRLFEVMQSDKATQDKFFAENPELATAAAALAASEKISISKAQLDYVIKALADNKDARWTVVLMHRPAWRAKSPEFEQIEKLLADRPYTVLAGHYHSYAYEKRHGRDYIVMSTTGGTQDANPNSPKTMDHVMLVTMGAGSQGPDIANIKLDGLYDREGPAVPGGKATAR